MHSDFSLNMYFLPPVGVNGDGCHGNHRLDAPEDRHYVYSLSVTRQSTVHYSTVQYTTAQHSTLHYTTVYCAPLSASWVPYY